MILLKNYAHNFDALFKTKSIFIKVCTDAQRNTSRNNLYMASQNNKLFHSYYTTSAHAPNAVQ